MPAKPKILPKPCPICQRKNGTVQFVVFSSRINDLICRIGHYSSKRYNFAVTKSKQCGLSVNYDARQDIKNTQRVWCSFRTKYGLFNKVKLHEWFENNSAKSWNFCLTQQLFDFIRINGWEMMENSSSRYKGRARKSLIWLQQND